MADIVLFHHIQGLTPGVIALRDSLADSGHTVHTPDLYAGHTFALMRDGVAYLRSLDPVAVDQQADDAVAALPEALVYAGISWGVSHAQRFAQTRPQARGAIFFDACFPTSGEGSYGPWPAGLPVQVHGMDHDEFFAFEGDLQAARELVASAGTDHAELFTYRGNAHLFIDSSLPTHDVEATQMALDRTLNFLARI